MSLSAWKLPAGVGGTAGDEGDHVLPVAIRRQAGILVGQDLVHGRSHVGRGLRGDASDRHVGHEVRCAVEAHIAVVRRRLTDHGIDPDQIGRDQVKLGRPGHVLEVIVAITDQQHIFRRGGWLGEAAAAVPVAVRVRQETADRFRVDQPTAELVIDILDVYLGDAADRAPRGASSSGWTASHNEQWTMAM